MKIKTQIEFLSFNDGQVEIRDVDDYGEPTTEAGKRYLFGNRTVGVNRYFSARQNDIELKKVIHVHQDFEITTQQKAIIDNTVYNIVQVQHLHDTNPKVTVLSLSQRGLYRGGAANCV